MPLQDLLSELAELLSDEDAGQGLLRVLARLAELGVHQAAGGEPIGLSVETCQRSLHLTGGDASLWTALAPLLKLGLRRAVEQERLTLLSEASFEGILVHVDGVTIDVNQRLAEMLGYRTEELLGSDVLRHAVAPEDLEASLERVATGYEGIYTVTAVRKDGSRFRAEVQSKLGRLGDRVVRIVAVRDITERERVVKMLLDGEQHLRDLALGAFDFMVVTQHRRFVYVGGKVQSVLGYEAEEMLGRDALDFVAPSEQLKTTAAIAEDRVGLYESILVSKSGEQLPIEVIGVRSTWHGEPARVAGFRDLRERHKSLRERRKLEQQLQRSQRLDSLGVLAGGIAHDFNNLLVGVIGNASLLQACLTDARDRQAADAIMAAGERAASLTKQMMAYAGRQDLGRRDPVDLGELFGELRTLLSATLSKKAHLRFLIATNSVVLGDRSPLMQVLMNLLTNASDALEGKPGKIDVRTSLVHELDSRWGDALGASVGPGDWVLVEVQDNGVGMNAATRQRVFEPFFSTKESGHGLGLAACLGIVTAHGGALLVESELGKGSCFSLVLPATTRREEAIKSDLPALTNEPCRVLVIDDEQLVRTQVRRALERRGYEIHEAPDGLSGIAAFDATSADVLLVDMTMPDIDGAEVVRRIRATGSRVAIVLSSGYQAQTASERLEAGAYQVFLPKPYSVNELVIAIETARMKALGL